MNEALLRLLAEIARRLRAIVSFHVVGGLGVSLRVSRSTSGRDDSIAILARAARATRDLDLALGGGDHEKARTLLESLGFRHEAEGKYRRGNDAIDLLTATGELRVRRKRRRYMPSEEPSVLLLPDDENEIETGEETRVLVPGSASLAIQKAFAFFNRKSERDLIDIGSLALSELASNDARDRLSSLDSSVVNLLASARDQFSKPDSRGPVVFADSARDSGLGDEEMRREVQAAVARFLPTRKSGG